VQSLRWEIEVSFLGPVELHGVARPFRRPWALELVTYLVAHREGASTEQWVAALWPDRAMAAATVHSISSEARRALGCSRLGVDHLPRAHGRLRLGNTVGSDWSRFGELSRRDDPGSWHRALRLVRGRPFDGLRTPDWPVLDGFQAEIETSIADLAERAALAHLGAGNGREAVDLLRTALLGCADERLYRLLLRALDAVGDRLGLEGVMEELAFRSGSGDSWTARRGAQDRYQGTVHRQTLDLYRELSIGGRQLGAGSR